MNKETKLKESHCGECKKPLDGATSVEGDYTPSENDLSVCIYCGAINQFNSDLELELCSEEVLNEIREGAPVIWLSLQKAQKIVKEIHDD